MTDERWEQVTTLLEKSFVIEEHEKEDLDPGQNEYYIFQGPLGKMKLERITRPKLIDRKMHTSARIGAGGREELIYSEDETVSFVKAYKWEETDGQWLEIDMERLIG